MLFHEILQFLAVECVRNDPGQPRAHVRLVAVANGLDQEFPQRPAFENDLAENVEHLAAKRLARLVQLLQQGEVDLALTGLLSDQIPQVADFGLPMRWIRPNRCSIRLGFHGKS